VGANMRSWETEELRAKLAREHGPSALRIVKDFEQRLVAEYLGRAVTVRWRGSRYRKDERATLWPWIEYDEIFYYPPVGFRVDGKVEVPFRTVGRVPERWNNYHLFKNFRTPFDEEYKRRELRDRLNEIPRISLRSGSLDGRSTFDLLLLEDRETFDKLVEVFGWYVSQIAPDEGRSRIRQELEHRRGMWASLLDAGGPEGVAPGMLRDLGIYGGAQGVWVDKARTGSLTEDGTGVTVGLLHTGSSYADDLSDDGVLYHYPSTNRPRGRDLAEIEATKAAGRLGLPVFVITYPSPGSAKRDVHLGWVENCDDSLEIFLITFGQSQPAPQVTDADEQPFRLVEEKRKTTRRQVEARTGQQRFKFLVFQRYGERCAVCGISAPQLLDAAHLRPKREHGSDDPRNGLVLCASHHRALDAGLFAIEPESLRIHFNTSGPDARSLRTDYPTLQHLPKKPHAEALQWLWTRWR
jgi:putative restriction endonuclease